MDAATTATLGGPGTSLLLFQSGVPIARRARGLRKVQLKKNNDALITNLPQPVSESSTADLIVHLSKPRP